MENDDYITTKRSLYIPLNSTKAKRNPAREGNFLNFYLSMVKFSLFNLQEFKITETELKLIAAAAIIGLR